MQTGHVFHRYFHAEIESFRFAGVDDGHGPIDGCERRGLKLGEGFFGNFTGLSLRNGCFRHRRRRRKSSRFPAMGACNRFLLRGFLSRKVGAAQEASDFFKRTLRCREADALQWPPNEMLKAFHRESEMRPALAGHQRVNFVDDHHFDGTQSVAGVGSKQEVKGFRSGD